MSHPKYSGLTGRTAVYPSVRHPGGICLAALRTGLLGDCPHAAYLGYNGAAMDVVFELN